MIQLLDVIALFLSCFAVLTLPLYLSLVRLLIVERSINFTGSFYDLFVVLSFLDMLAVLSNFLGVSLTGWGITTSFAKKFASVYGVAYLTVSWFCRVNQGLSSALIAVNRSYAMIMPLRYTKVWRKVVVRRLQLLQVLPGLVFSLFIAFFDVNFQEFPDFPLRQITVQIINPTHRSLLYKAAGVIEVGLILIILASYGSGIAFLLSKEARRPAHDYSFSKKKSKAEKSATFMGISICCLEVFYFFYSAFAVFFTIPANTYFSIHSSMNDLYSSLNCYFILLFSESVRRRLFRKFYSNKQIEPSVTGTAPRGSSNAATMSVRRGLSLVASRWRNYASTSSAEAKSSVITHIPRTKPFALFSQPRVSVPLMEISRKIGGNIAETLYQFTCEKSYSRESLIRGANEGAIIIGNCFVTKNWNKLASITTADLCEQLQEVRERINDTNLLYFELTSDNLSHSFLYSTTIAGKRKITVTNLGIYFTVVSFFRLQNNVPDNISLLDALGKYNDDIIVVNITFARTLNPLGVWKATAFNVFTPKP